MTNPFELTATDAIKLIGNNKLSRYEWVQSCFERIREKEDLVKAWVYLDEDRALEKAKQLDNENDKSQLGIPFGIMFGLFAGGWINEYFGWRIAFFVVGIPGIILAIIFRFTVQEPKRGQAEGRADTKEQPSIIETAKYLLNKKFIKTVT